MLAEEFPDHRPHGVCGQIVPWNFPLLMLAWKAAPALATGNTVVLKPAELTPLTALAFAGIAREAGIPKGVLNIVTGDGATGAALVAAEVDKIAFTGSTEVGRDIRRATAGSGKALTLELGGKSPFIVFDDADLDAAVEGVVDAIWFNQGEVCCAGARLLVQEGVAGAFTARLRRRMETLRTGDPLDKSADMGAIVSPGQRDRIAALVAQGVAEGAELWQPGTIPAAGCYYPPTLLTGVAPASTVSQVEIFGPVATLTTFRTPDEAAALANNTAYGLAASIWSESIGQALEIATRVRAGVIWINATNLFDAGAPFGGMRESGFGREGGRPGMQAYLAPRGPRRKGRPRAEPSLPALSAAPMGAGTGTGIDRTAKLYVGGRQVRPDSGHGYGVTGPRGQLLGIAGLGNRKDIRNAVEAAARADGWSRASGHERAQVLYYLAENLGARAADLAGLLRAMTGGSAARASAEVEATLTRIFWYAGQADKIDGATHATRSRHITLTLPEPWGVMGLVCPTEAPLLGLLSLVLPAIAAGNRVVAVPSQTHPLAASELYQLLDTSDVPAGVVNLVTGPRDDLARTLAEHDEVAALWYVGPVEGGRMVQTASAGNLKATWVNRGRPIDWAGPEGQGAAFLRRATQIKTIWVPYGA